MKRQTLIMSVLVTSVLLLTGCSKQFPIPMSVFEEYQETFCRNEINGSMTDVTKMVHETSNLYRLAGSKEIVENPEFIRIFKARESYATSRENCGKPFPNTPDFQDGSPSILSKVANLFSTKPKCDSEETKKAILNEYAEKLVGSLFKSLTTDEIKSNLSIVDIKTVNEESSPVNCKGSVQLKLDKGFEEVLIDDKDKVYKLLSEAYMNSAGMKSMVIPSTALSVVGKLSVELAMNTGFNTPPEKIRSDLIKELETWDIPIKYTASNQDGLKTNLTILDEGLAVTSAYMLSYTKNGLELLKELKKANDKAAAPAAAAPAAAAPAAAAPAAAAPAAAAPAAAAPVVETTSPRASFDCNKATSPQEKMICSSTSLGDADIKLNSVYKSAMQRAANPEQLKKEQVAWIKNVRNSCNDTQCLSNTMNNRITELSKQ